MLTPARPSHPARRVLRTAGRRLPLPVRMRARYLRTLHRWPSLRRPVLFTEKVHWRMLRDRRDLVAGTCDKLAAKEAARAAGVPGLRVPATLWCGTDVRELAGVDLPGRWVLKPNHRVGKVVFGSGPADVEGLRRQTGGWLEDTLSPQGEWAYGRARRLLLVEEMVGDEPPVDHKFYVFDGEVHLVQVDTHRFTGHRSSLYSPGWEPVGGPTWLPPAAPMPRPQRLDDLLEAASILGRDFDFIRVDLYDVGGRTWFGELTPYPAHGLMSWEPRHLDAELGAHWQLPAGAAGRAGTQNRT